jgi:hypothetical protein
MFLLENLPNIIVDFKRILLDIIICYLYACKCLVKFAQQYNFNLL